MTTFLIRNIFLVAFLSLSLWTPPAYSGGQHTDLSSERTLVEKDRNRAKDFIGECFDRTELFFGSAKPDGSVVSETEFQQFLNQEITPRFPDGLTLLGSLGQFRDSSGVILRERSMLLILLYPGITRRASSEKIEQIREAYQFAFQQQSVLRADRRCERVGF